MVAKSVYFKLFLCSALKMLIPAACLYSGAVVDSECGVHALIGLFLHVFTGICRLRNSSIYIKFSGC